MILFTSNDLHAEYCDDFPLDPACDDGSNQDAPIDSGVGLLLGAAAFYTVKKIREKRGGTVVGFLEKS